MSQDPPKPGCLSLVLLVGLGALFGVLTAVPAFYVVVFGGDLTDLVETARHRIAGHRSACEPGEDTSMPARADGRSLPPPMLCVPFAARTLDVGTVVGDEDLVHRLLPPDFLPEQALRTVPPGSTVAAPILEGELLRRERLR